jgi:sigma-B regulation protein RsbU (phosphoserine phosphatase)
MTIHIRNIPVSFLIRRSVRYLLVSHGFRLLQAVAVLAMLSFVLTGSRIAAIDRLGNRADIVASIFITIATIALLRALNRRVMTAIDRRFFREAYNAQLILTELGEAIPTLSRTNQLIELVANKINDALHPENIAIFLDDPDARAYLAMFSFAASYARIGPTSRLRGRALHYDDALIQRLMEAELLNAVEVTEADFVSPSPGVEGESTPAHYSNQTSRPSLLIPIASNGHLHGLISLGPRLSDLPYATEDKRLLLVVANQIATFIGNMTLISRMAEEQRIARELEMAAEVQRHLFPADGLENDALDIYGTCLPARSVGGDYYDYFETGDRRTAVAIADVAGKGIAAALVMSTVQASLRCQLISEDRSLANVVSLVSRLLQRSTSEGGYATFFLAEFNEATRALTYVNAGHNPPILVRGGAASYRGDIEPVKTPAPARYSSSKVVGIRPGIAVPVAEKPVVKLLTTGGPIIGTFLTGPYEQETIQLQSGDMLVIYTDGVTEALNPTGIEFGEAKLRSILLESLRLSAHEAAKMVLEKVLRWEGQAAQHDDITLIVMKVK